jgi:hypothetical protein
MLTVELPEQSQVTPILMPTIANRFLFKEWCTASRAVNATLCVQLTSLNITYTKSDMYKIRPQITLTMEFEDDIEGRLTNAINTLCDTPLIRVGITNGGSEIISYFNFTHVSIENISYTLAYASSSDTARYIVKCSVGRISRTID